MEQDIQIREFTGEDIAVLHRLLQNTIDISYQEVYPPEAVKLFKEYNSEKQILIDAVDGYTIAVVYNGEIVGTGTLVGDHISHISRVYIDPQYQHRGMGKMIVRELENKALKEELTIINLDGSLASRDFWESLGYNVRKEDSIPVENDRRLYLYRMSKTFQ